MKLIIQQKVFLAWLVFTIAAASYLGAIFFVKEDKTDLLPGITTSGHYQIEMRCEQCHVEESTFASFTASGVTNKACLACHKMDLDQANDSHPVVKFRNPENAIFLDKIQATQCIACHTEHQEEHTRDMGVTLPADYCTHCHQVTLENRESHKGLAFNTCATAGCHNYHDNQALFEDFLLAHQSDPDHFEEALLTHHIAYPKPSPDAPSPSPNGASSHPHSGNATLDWAASAHAAAQVNCSDCHNDSSGKWVDQPHPVQSCQSCHDTQVDDFHRGKHGMRLALGLPAMTPKEAR
ncbi:MAG: cytochrome c3 family protein, partial [Verrucomicrobiota bacterium]